MSSTAGFILSMVGGLLDFASGASLLAGGMGPMGMEGYMGVSALWLALSLFALGAAVVGTAVASAMMIGMRLVRLFQTLMMLYGAAMLAVGWVMLNGATSFYGYAMLAVGALMVVNGAAMGRAPTAM